MPLSLAGYILVLSALGLLLSAASAEENPSNVKEVHSENVKDDTTGAQLLVERQGEMVRVQGAFTSDSIGPGTLTYELGVRRTGDAGTSQSTQSGRFDTTPGQTDTLSTVRVNVQSGDQVDLHLTIHQDGALVDEVRQQCTF